MGRLEDKLKAAAGVAPRQAQKIEARADAILAQETMIETETDSAFGPHEALLAEAQKGLDEISRALAVVSNGGPPLEPSAASPASPEANPSPQPGGS